ncbi:ERBB receptor feedback inhibitor 1 [Thalassophryne amazonica]|uniref:ERBB receptor feedback inhibitor 1 n=1 Tax=Thalassophryne amazonica TaxID=390379 RepID=UPI0014714E15|nr:ERBB receptor feedback inhibitor 1 [Thalassophryne amazonica]
MFFCCNMARNQKTCWGQDDMDRLCFGLNHDIERNLTEVQQQQTINGFNGSISYFFSETFTLTPDKTLQAHEGDQVVPSSQRRSLFGGYQRETKPLPPPPDPEELMSDEATDSEVEFFTSDRCRLLPKSCPKPLCRVGNKGCGQINYAYQDSVFQDGSTGTDSMAYSWPGSEDRAAWGGFESQNWIQAQESHVFCGPESRLHFSCSSSASHHLPGSITAYPPDKPQIPPRVPIPPKPSSMSKTTNSLSIGDEDKPPKIPPRVPLVPACPPRTPSPKSLPIYINGVMPPTQSFAANPEYVSRALQRQQSEGAPPAAQCSPYIVPILKDGRQASATHYILLPGRPACTERRERLLSEPNTKPNSRVWQNR